METLVIALGGNALLNKGDSPTFEVQMGNVSRAARGMANVLSWRDMQFVITHGNGPQVGQELLRNEHAGASAPSLPLHILTAETQAFIGSMLQRAILRELQRRHVNKKVCTVLTHTLVDKGDPAFRRPTKPVGPFYTKEELMREMKSGRFDYVKTDGAYRRVVASPRPIRVLEADTIARLLKDGYNVICGGGGGIPLYADGDGYAPADSVIDKDLATQVIANSIGARRMVILTAVEHVYRDYEHRKDPIRSASCAEIRRMLGGFEEGSIKPKLEACARFIENGGRVAQIGHLSMLDSVIRGASGTTIARK